MAIDIARVRQRIPTDLSDTEIQSIIDSIEGRFDRYEDEDRVFGNQAEVDEVQILLVDLDIRFQPGIRDQQIGDIRNTFKKYQEDRKAILRRVVSPFSDVDSS